MKRNLKLAIFALTPLLIPLIAMQLTSEVDWSLLDFLVAGIILLILAFSIRTIVSSSRRNRVKIILLIAVLLLFLLVWIELAVGLFDSPLAGS